MSRSTLLLLVVALVGGLYQNRDAVERWFNPPSVEQAGVVLYSTAWCGYCKRMRALFKARGIPYREKDIETSARYQQEFLALGGTGVPMVVVDGRTVIRGYRPKAVLQAVQR
ncbi:glutaredoxin family protein [Gallaecimonas sp. GXIMD4217]|uniref:glutaredoxin family protein n=1 Tax=Gallaecimonas sp. GXIMD4217 TaxID=3131927 RepID=UPI00311B1F52